MRKLFGLLVFCGLTLGATPNTAQQQMICDDGRLYPGAISLFITREDSSIETTVTALGLDDLDPVLRLADESGTGFCNIESAASLYYEVDLPGTGPILPSSLSAQEYLSGSARIQVDLAEYEARTGTFALIIEGGSLNSNQRGDLYEMPISATQRNTGQPLELYVFSMEGAAMRIEVLDAEDRVSISSDVPAEASVTLFNGESLQTDENSASLSLPLDEVDEALRFRVRATRGQGAYVVVMLVATGLSQDGDGTARLEAGQEGALSLFCDDVLISESAVALQLPDTGLAYTISLAADSDADPIMAVLSEENSGTCYDNQDSASPYSAMLPGLNIAASPLSAQAQAQGGQRIILATREQQPVQMAVFIEGAMIDSDGRNERYQISLMPALRRAEGDIQAYMIATDEILNPYMELTDEMGRILTDGVGLPYTCDDAGFPDACHEGAQSLRGARLQLANGRTLVGLDLDAALIWPVNEAGPDQQNLAIHTNSAGNDSEGNYLLLILLQLD